MMQAIRRRREAESGFTLIELLVVIAILGILAAVVVFAVGGVTDRGKQSACKSDVQTVQTASEAFNAKNGVYAASIDALVAAKFLRSAPGTGNGYTINYTAADGSVSSTPACSTIT